MCTLNIHHVSPITLWLRKISYDSNEIFSFCPSGWENEWASEQENRRNGGCREPSDSPDNEKHSLLRQWARPDDWSVRGISASIIFHQVKSTRLQPAKHSIDNCEPSLAAEREREEQRQRAEAPRVVRRWKGPSSFTRYLLHALFCRPVVTSLFTLSTEGNPDADLHTMKQQVTPLSCKQILQQVNKGNWIHRQR